LAQIANATGLDAGEIWHDNSPDAGVEAVSVMDEIIVANGADLILTQGSTDMTAGAVRFLLAWYPVSYNGLVVPSLL